LMGTNNGTAAAAVAVHTSSFTPPTTVDSTLPSTVQDTHAGITAAAAATIAAQGLTASTAFGDVLAGATEGSNSSQPQSSFALDRLPAPNTKRATKRSRYPHGVTWNAQRRMWWARVVFDPSSHRDFKGLGQFIPRQTIDLGTFINEDEAAHAHDAAAIEVHGEGAPINFPAFPAWARIQDREKYAVCHGDMSWQQGFNRVSNGGIARRAGGVGGGAGGALNSMDQSAQQQMQPKEPPLRSEFLGVCLAKYVPESMCTHARTHTRTRAHAHKMHTWFHTLCIAEGLNDTHCCPPPPPKLQASRSKCSCGCSAACPLVLTDKVRRQGHAPRDV
jgi:hypothetical protein